MKKKDKKKKAILYTETTFADMNVEGFSWYDPNRKKGKKTIEKLTEKEQKALIRGAYRAVLPLIFCMVACGLLLMLLVYLWLK